LFYYFWAPILTIIGATIIICGAVYYKSAKRNLQPYPLFVKEVQQRRNDIERSIGSFEMPKKIEVKINSGKTPLTYLPTLDYVFQLRGTRGLAQGIMRLVKMEKTQKNVHPLEKPKEYSWEVEKFRIELMGIENSGVLTSEEKDFTTPHFIDNAVILSVRSIRKQKNHASVKEDVSS